MKEPYKKEIDSYDWIKDSIPMGIGQWIAYGEKWGYAEFYADKIKKEMVDIFTKKTQNDKGEPICPKCGKDMERDVQEPQGYLWFCKCTPSLRLSVG